jgi:hypothetical protein
MMNEKRSALRVLCVLAVLCVLLPSCAKDDDNGGGSDADTDTDTDTDADSDTDTDTDTDTDDGGTGDGGTGDVLLSFAFGYGDAADGLYSGYVASTFAGLECVIATTPADGDWSLALVNFPAGCVPPDLLPSVPFAGTAETSAAGALAVTAVWQDEGALACGDIEYYFDYLIEPFAVEGALDLAVEIADCTSPECARPVLETAVDLFADAPAMACRYTGGASGADPGSAYAGSADGGCDEDLVARTVDVPFGDTAELCLPACGGASTACPHPEVETCEDGVCVIEEPLALTEL